MLLSLVWLYDSPQLYRRSPSEIMDKIFANKATLQIVHCLYSRSVCSRCILRILKVQSLQMYRDRSKMIEFFGKYSEIATQKENPILTYDLLKLIKKGDNPVCTLCLGLLQECDSSDKIKQIGDQIRKEQFVFERFKFLIKTPNSLMLRYAQMMNYVKEYLKELGEGYQTVIFNNWEQKQIEVKTVLKWVMAPLLSTEIGSHSTIQDDALEINLRFQNAGDEEMYFSIFSPIIKALAQEKLQKKMEKIQRRMKPEKFEQLKESVERLDPSIANMNKILDLDQQFFFKTLLKSEFAYTPKEQCNFEIEIRRGSIFLFGNYVKYSRFLSQTPWVVYGKKLTESSIQEELERVVLKHFYPEGVNASELIKFHSGGREDIDVRMLSTGRPFALEFCSPRFVDAATIQGFSKQIQEEANKSKYVKVNSLKFTTSQCLEILKKSEIQKTKAYSCFVHFQKPFTPQDVQRLNSVTDLVLNQKTPLRVLHRRTLMVRNKIIHKLFASPIDNQNMILNVLSSAGTYIKQFVHGDLERTFPNVCSLTSNKADIFQLDVLKLYQKLDQEAVEDFLKVAVKIDI